MNRITWIAMGSLIAACGSSSDKPSAEEYDDTAQAIASTTSTGGSGGSGTGGGDVASMADSFQLSLGVTSGFSLVTDGHFHTSRLGVDYNYNVACKSSGNTVACGLANEATVDVDWSGSLTTTNFDASVDRSGSWTLTGLQGDTATVSGNSSFSFEATLRSIFRPGVTSTYTFDTDASYDGVLISKQDKTTIGGSASFDLTAHHKTTGSDTNVDKTFDVHAELTFKADHTADLVLDDDHHYSLNVTTGVVVRVN